MQTKDADVETTIQSRSEIVDVELSRAAGIFGTHIGLFTDRCADKLEHSLAVLTGCPVQTYLIESFITDIDRGENSGERLDKLYNILNEAIRYGWVMCAHTQPLPADEAEKMDPITQRFATINNKGIKYSHTYTILNMRKVVCDNGFNDVLLLLRNPWGKD